MIIITSSWFWSLQYEPDERDDLDTYQELCYEVTIKDDDNEFQYDNDHDDDHNDDYDGNAWCAY